MIFVAGLATSGVRDHHHDKLAASSPQSISGVSGINFCHLLADIRDNTPRCVTGSDVPGNQNPDTVASTISTVFGVPTPTLTLNDENSRQIPITDSVPLGLNYAAIHQDSGELIFFYSTLQTSFTIEGFQNGTPVGPGLAMPASIRQCPLPVIGHGLLVLLAVGGVFFGGKLVETPEEG